MNVQVVIAMPSCARQLELELHEPCTAREAVQLAVRKGLQLDDTGVDPATVKLGVYGELVADDYTLADGDRLELYRPLQQNPMDRRRQKAALEAGRFSKRRK